MTRQAGGTLERERKACYQTWAAVDDKGEEGEGERGCGGGRACVFCQQLAVCRWEVLATEAMPDPFNSGRPLPAPSRLRWGWGGGDCESSG